MIGTVIGSYRVVRRLGKGGMGSVYLAEHTLLGRKAAIKVLRSELSAREDIVNRFFNEARAATAINDAGIVQVFDFGHHVDASAYIVMEYLDGETLFARIRRTGRLPVDEAMRLARQIATSLAAAHAKRIVHRDLKPENVFIVADAEAAAGERAKILDFGIAKLSDEHVSKVHTTEGAIMGTPLYMSPEQCRGEGVVDHRADIYALGCVLYCMIGGRPPFDAKGVGDIIAMHLREPPAPLSSIVDGVAPAIDALVLRCLAKDPADRFATMHELAAAIAALAPGAATMVSLRAHAPRPVSISVAETAESGPESTAAAMDSTAMSPAPAMPAPVPTTLGSTVGQVATAPVPRPRGWFAVGLLGGAAAVATLYMVLREGTPARNDAAPAAIVVTADAAPPPDGSSPDASPPDAAPTPPRPPVIRHVRPRASHPAIDAGAPAPPATPKDPLDLDGDGIPDIRR